MSMQVRASIQRALGRPLPLEEIGTMTIGGLKALAVAAGGGSARPSTPALAKTALEKPSEGKQPKNMAQEAAKDGPKAAGAENVSLHQRAYMICLQVHANVAKHNLLIGRYYENQ